MKLSSIETAQKALYWTMAIGVLGVIVVAFILSSSQTSSPQSDTPPLHLAPAGANAPGDFASPEEWDRYYKTPEGKKQLQADIASLGSQLQDPKTRARVEEILDRYEE